VFVFDVLKMTIGVISGDENISGHWARLPDCGVTIGILAQFFRNGHTTGASQNLVLVLKLA